MTVKQKQWQLYYLGYYFAKVTEFVTISECVCSIIFKYVIISFRI